MTKDVYTNKHKDIEGLYRDVHKWISEIHFVQDEMVFAKKLLTSDVFEPGTANLFERIREYVSRLDSCEIELARFKTELQHYEVQLGTLLEFNQDDRIDVERKHSERALQLEQTIEKFKMLKSEIFEYAGGIFRKKRR